MAVEPKGDPIATSAEDGKQGDGAVVYGSASGSASGSVVCGNVSASIKMN